MTTRLFSALVRLISRTLQPTPHHTPLTKDSENETFLPSHSSPSSPPTSRLRALLPLLLSFTLGALTFHLLTAPSPLPLPLLSPVSSPIYNATLGFERIYAIGFEDRTDKRDALTLAAAITSLDITFERGVRAEDVPHAARPDGWVPDFAGDGPIGCWRAHMDVMQKIVRENIATALILEDDADWDVSIKEQLAAFAEGVLAIRNDTASRSGSPYGDDWDLLWVGACEVSEPRFERRFYVIPNDPTVAPREHATANWLFHRPPEVDEPNTRLIFTPGQGTCTTAYAISQTGARRLLTAQSLHPFSIAIDRKLARMCGQFPNESPFRCVAAYPPYFSMHRASGSNSKDSEIWKPLMETWHEEYSFDVVYSAVMNVGRVLEGETVRAQWGDGSVGEGEVEVGRKWGFGGGVRELEVAEHRWDEDCVFCPP